MWAICLNATLGFIMAITFIFTLGDIDSILATQTLEPFIQVFYNATGSYTGTNIMTAVVIVLLTSCCISEVATSSRQLWSFARDRGLPGSSWLAIVRIFSPQTMDSTNFLGDAWLEHPDARSHCFPCGDLCTCLYQPGFFSYTQRHQLSRCRGDSLILHYYHRLPHLETASRGTTTTATMVARKIRSRHQHCCYTVLNPVLVFRTLATLYPGNCC